VARLDALVVGRQRHQVVLAVVVLAALEQAPALAFGVLMVFLLIVGSNWIMPHMNHNMMPMGPIMRMLR